MKKLNLVLRILWALLLIMPIGGALGFFPEPTADMYSTPEAWAFMDALMQLPYMMYLMAICFGVAAVLLFVGRQALAALILLPITVNIIAFHVFLDATLIAPESIMAYVFLALNGYFLWYNKDHYKTILAAH